MSIAELFPQTEILKNVQVIVVDNDRDTRDLYACLLESYGAKVTTLGSVKAACDFLEGCIPALLICEMRFLGESVCPLIQRAQDLALSSAKQIPILATSTYSPTHLAQEFRVNFEAYLLKPVDIDDFVAQVRQLTLRSSVYSPSIQDWVMDFHSVRVKTVPCGTGVI
jgi:CheY-like chemotaxis protein